MVSWKLFQSVTDPNHGTTAAYPDRTIGPATDLSSSIGLRISISQFHLPTHLERHAILAVVTNLSAAIYETLAAQGLEKCGAKCGL